MEIASQAHSSGEISRGTVGPGPRIVPLAEISETAWDALDWPGKAPMSGHHWVRSAAKIYATTSPAQALVVGSTSAPLAAMPLYEPPEALGTWRLLGALDLGESTDMPSSDERSLQQLARQLWQLDRPIDLGHLPTDTAFYQSLRQHRPTTAVMLSQNKPEAALPRLHLDDTWQDPGRGISRNHRQSLARKRRRATAEFGEPCFRILAPGPGDAAAAISTVFDVEAKSWKSRAGTALRQQPKQAAFFQHFGAVAARHGQLRIALLEFAESPAAVHYGIEDDGVFWSIRVGYDERFAAVSPGELLMYDLIRVCATRGLSRLELCGKEAAWTRRWTDIARPIAAVRLYPSSWRGYAGLARDATVLGARQIQKRIRTDKATR